MMVHDVGGDVEAPRTALALARGKPSECQESRQSQVGHSVTGLRRMASSPKYLMSNSPYASSRSTMACPVTQS